MSMRALPLIIVLTACGNETGLTPDITQEDPGETVLLPALQIEPVDVVFEPVAPGELASGIFTVTNIGEAQLDVVDVAFTDGPRTFSFQALDGTALLPGESADWSVTYEPERPSAAADLAHIAMVSNDPERPRAVVSLTGTTLNPAFELTPTSHDFGDVDVGERALQELVLINTGAAPGTVEQLSFTTTSPELSLVDLGELGALPTVVDPGETLRFTAMYEPVDVPGDEATVELLTDAPETPIVQAALQGNGYAVDHEVEIFLTADDAWTGFVDGVEFTAANQRNWQKGDTHVVTLSSGRHVLAIQATDVSSVISGFIAIVKVDGAIVSRTGEGDWKMQASAPPSGWMDPSFDASSWGPAVQCADQSTWGTYWPADFYAEGAKWVWWTDSCRNLKQAWFRMELDL